MLGLGYAKTCTNIKEFHNFDDVHKKLAMQLNSTTNLVNLSAYKSLVYKYKDDVNIKFKIKKMFSQLGCLSEEGVVYLTKILDSEFPNYYIIVYDSPVGNIPFGKEYEENPDFLKYITLLGILHRQTIISQICKIIPCKVRVTMHADVEDMEEKLIMPYIHLTHNDLMIFNPSTGSSPIGA